MRKPHVLRSSGIYGMHSHRVVKKVVVREAQNLTRSAILIRTPPRSMLR